MTTTTFVLPGEDIPSSLLPTPSTGSSAAPLKLGPGLAHIPPDTITPVVAGNLCTDARKNAIWVENPGGRYIPAASDLVIATVHHSSMDFYHCTLSPFSSLAQLPQLSFEGATKKTRPILAPGAVVYARVSLANKHMDPEIECVHPSTGKSEGLGELKGGMVFDISLSMARRLMMPRPREQGRVVVLEELAERIPFEIAVGRNGKVWVDSESVRGTLAVGRAIQETDRRGLGVDEQVKLVKNLVKGL
ncbi:hypothetical protein L228DRAFT_264005 [Xylona heveae TC161]|uniref:Ribosomal RNA-processing protein 40 n=1 Tax=Xylona heveae (strain CBS 132557 / TC161) TaxID=1328760 RepID=A0A164ZLS2_XYLHT|nr:hypothetical protein L228DRAFT_264005 [Xylona heveae TC161]KZF19254.1 hypothetical protein L228DRAFT_264005 [Xylona heveae TC161]